jgi:DNA-binding MarR family transcriptional regulator
VDHTAYWLHRLSTDVLARFEHRLSEHGVTVAQWKVLIALYREDATSPLGLATFIAVDSGAITRVVDRLLAKGLIVRKPSSTDRRSIDLGLSPGGKALIRDLVVIADVEDDAWLESLPTSELAQFKRTLAKLLRARGMDVPRQWSETK